MVSFELTDEQREIRDWVHSFAEKEIRPVAHQYDESEEFPWPVVKKAAEVGLYGVEFLQQTYADTTGIMPALVAEELTWGCAGIALAIQGTGLPIAAIFSQGTPEQIATWIPACFGTVEKPALGAFAVTEPEAGSDVSSMKTRAVRSNGDWVINGQKIFITNGGIADVHVVVASVEPELGTRGQASFVVPPGTKGIRQGKKERKMGIRASNVRAVATHRRSAGARHRSRRVRVCAAVRERAQAVRPDADRERGDRVHARGHGDRDRGHAGAHLAGVVGRPQRRRVQEGRGLDGEAEGRRGRGQGDGAGDPDLRRLRLHQGLPGREVAPRRQDLHALRRHQRDPAARHLASDRPRLGRTRRTLPNRAVLIRGTRGGCSGVRD